MAKQIINTIDTGSGSSLNISSPKFTIPKNNNTTPSGQTTTTPKLTLPKNNTGESTTPKLTLPKNNTTSTAPKNTTQSTAPKISITPEEMTARLKGANISAPIKNTTTTTETTKPANPFRLYQRESTSESRTDPSFTRNTASWLNTAGTTGTKRNRKSGDMYDWEAYTDDNGNQVSGLWAWYNDNGARYDAVLSFAEDGKWHDRNSMRGYMQEAANLYYDYDEMVDYMSGIISDMENKVKTGTYDSESAKKADEAYIASMKTNLESAKSLRDSSRKIYQYMSGQNKYMDAYDDYHVKDSSDAKNYSETYKSEEYGTIPGGKTPETWDGIVKSIQSDLDEMAPANSEKGQAQRFYWREHHDGVDIEAALSQATYARDKATEEKAQMERDNLGIMFGRDYYGMSGLNSWKAEEKKLQSTLELTTNEADRKTLQDKIDYVHDIVKAGEYKNFYDKWKDASEEDLIKRIIELGEDPNNEDLFYTDKDTEEVQSSKTIDDKIEALKKQASSLGVFSDERAKIQEQIDELEKSKETTKTEEPKVEEPKEKTAAEIKAEKDAAELKELELDAINYARQINAMKSVETSFNAFKKANPGADVNDWISDVNKTAEEKEKTLEKAIQDADDTKLALDRLFSVFAHAEEGRVLTPEDLENFGIDLHGVKFTSDLNQLDKEINAVLEDEVEAARMAYSMARQQKASISRLSVVMT